MEKMNKRALSAIKRPEVTTEILEAFRNSDSKTGIVTAGRQEVEGKETLIVNVFHKDKDQELRPYFRIFCQMDGDITQDLIPETVKWKTGIYASIAGDTYYAGFCKSFTDYRIASDEDLKVIKSFVQKYETERSQIKIWGKEFNDYLNAYQTDIRERRNKDKHKAIIDRFDQRMSQFSPLPDDYQQFVEDVVLGEDQFLFYNRKQHWAYCTKCKQSIVLDRVDDNDLFIAWEPDASLKHNMYIECPHCGATVMAKSSGYSRQNMKFVNWAVMVQAHGDDVFVRYIRSIKDFSKDFRNPEYKTSEYFRTVHTPSSQEDYEVWWYQPTGEYRWRYPVRHMFFFETPYNVPAGGTVLYNSDWSFLKTTCMRYSCIDMAISKIHPDMGPWDIDRWFKFYHQYPFVEQLIKIGWYGLVRELDDEIGRETIRELKSERTVCKILGITKEQFRYLKESTNNNPKLIDIAIMRYAQQAGVRITPEDHKELRTICFRTESRIHEKIINLAQYRPIHRIIKWFTAHKYEVRSNDYFDYIRWAGELGYNLHNEQILLPKSFKEMHDRFSAEYIAMKDRLKQEEKEKFNILLAQMRNTAIDGDPLNMHAAGLIIRRPLELDELKKEGEALHHCVGTYIGRVMEGSTQIFFIRKESEPDKPFFTMEWHNHHMIQCRGSHNCDMTPEVKAFTEVFSERMIDFENKLQKKILRQRIKAVV